MYDFRTRSRQKSPHTPYLPAGLESLADVPIVK